MKKNSQLDEMQEQKLLQIEHNMAWIAFWGILAAMVVQMFLFGPSRMDAIAGEWIVFMILAVYLAVSCVRSGIWDRKLKPDAKTNFLGSLIGAGAVFVVSVFFVYRNTANWKIALLASAILGLVTLALCFGAMMLVARVYKKRVAKLEDDPQDG